MRIGVLGGTFDPIHVGHLRVAEEVAEKMGLGQVLFIPAARPPHRRAPLTSAPHRLAMVKLAIAGNPRFTCTDLELKRPGKSYAVDTLDELHRRYPARRFFLIVGADQVLALPNWREPGRLVRACRVVAISRPGLHLPEIRKKTGRVFPPALRAAVSFLPVRDLDISSTDIRRRLRAGQSTRYLLPATVRVYIRHQGLYS